MFKSPTKFHVLSTISVAKCLKYTWSWSYILLPVQNSKQRQT